MPLSYAAQAQVALDTKSLCREGAIKDHERQHTQPIARVGSITGTFVQIQACQQSLNLVPSIPLFLGVGGLSEQEAKPWEGGLHGASQGRGRRRW